MKTEQLSICEAFDGLIRHATAVVFPSITEGFGLPIVEAMGRGTAVITSAGGATEETAGEAALLVDPFDTAALAEALQAVESDAKIRQRLEAAGPARPGRGGSTFRAIAIASPNYMPHRGSGRL